MNKIAIQRYLTPANHTKALPKKLLGYALNPLKTNETLVAGIGCLPNIEDALRSMENTKAIHHKTDGRQVIHSVLSFDTKEPVTEQEVLSISKQIAREVYRDYQCVIAVHTNTVYLHSHFIVNSVDIHGRKFNLHRKEFFQQRNMISQILIRNGKQPIVGFSEDDYRERELSEEDMDSDDWMELYPENEKVVIMSGNTLPDITLEVAECMSDDCDDEPSLSQCYFFTLAQKHGFAVARCICDAELHHQDDNYEEDNDMKSKPTIRIGGGVIITTNKSDINQNADLCGEIIRRIPEEILYTHDIEIYTPNEIRGVSQEIVDEIANEIGRKSSGAEPAHKQLPELKK